MRSILQPAASKSVRRASIAEAIWSGVAEGPH
jgi:hypothetical protein